MTEMLLQALSSFKNVSLVSFNTYSYKHSAIAKLRPIMKHPEINAKLVIAADTFTSNYISNPDIVIVHHPNILKNPHNYPKSSYLVFKYSLSRIMRKSSKLVVFSQFSKNTLLEETNIDESDIHLVHPFSMLPIPSRDDIVNVMNRFNIKASKKIRVIAVGTSVLHKNFGTLYKAVRNQDIDVIRIGGNASMERKTFGEIPDNVTYIEGGSLSDIEMAALYKLSDMLVFTGTDEGFGRPLIEAMSLGLPVIGNFCTTVPEIIGENQLKIKDPFNYEDLRKKIFECFADLSFYMSDARKRAEMYSREKCISDLQNIVL
ncbi:MAG: glycosyltransferase [Candidatus Parvarchaeota archaeon]